MVQMKRLVREHSWLHALVALVIGFALTWMYVERLGITEAYHDSGLYREMGQFFLDNGLFSWDTYIEQYGDSYRGYLFGWLIALCESCGGYRLWISLIAACVCTLLTPALIGRVFDVKLTAWRRLVILALFCVLFQGLLTYPLTDLWAVGFGMLCVYAMLAATGREPTPVAVRIGYGFVFGLSLSAAYNIRTIYLLLFAAIPCLLVMALFHKGMSWPVKGGVVLAAAAGFLLVAWPQMLINQTVYENPTFMLLSDEGSSLFINQLYDGIYEMKYETLADPNTMENGIFYVDKAGEALLHHEYMITDFYFGNGAQQLDGMEGYFDLVIRYPLDFLGIYMRHLFNLFDIRHPEVYVREAANANLLYPILNYTVLFFALATVWRKFQNPEWKGRGQGALVAAIAGSYAGDCPRRY